MLNEGMASGPYDGRVYIKVRGDWDGSMSMDYNEFVYDAVTKTLTVELGFRVFMLSMSD